MMRIDCLNWGTEQEVEYVAFSVRVARGFVSMLSGCLREWYGRWW